MVLDEAINIASQLDTYIYAMIVLVVWNFVWTKRVRNKVFGSDEDPTNDGLAVEVADLEDRVDELEVQHRFANCSEESFDWHEIDE